MIARLREFTGNVALFSHGHFSRVLAVRWIGLQVAKGQHFKLGTASISILSQDPHHPNVPVITLWNAISPKAIETGGTRAIERWENEGGEIPNQPHPD